MRFALRSIVLCGLVVLSSWAAWGAGLNPFGPSGLPLTQGDFAVMAKAVDPLLNDETVPIGTMRSWSNPRSGNQGTVTLERRFTYDYQGSKLPCRTLRYHTVIRNYADPYNLRLNRCKAPDGEWMLL